MHRFIGTRDDLNEVLKLFVGGSLQGFVGVAGGAISIPFAKVVGEELLVRELDIGA